MSKGNYKKKKKGAGGRKPLPNYKRKVRVVTFVSPEDLKTDAGKKAFEESANKELSKLSK